ncbi:hypothetical protein V6617_01880 [Pelagibacterium nitratireducens]|uniref:Uncharacterized protein n=1 Tax=Pelagibacterium nitratireducens TaxID=1046114 RepID=A0ABZ2I062_9HYPH
MSELFRILSIALGIFLTALLQTAAACDNRLSVWDLPLGTSASELLGTFQDHACGTNGGPPSRPLSGFEDYHLCETDEQGFYEVYFRYDDEQEFVARALEQDRRIAMCQGTRVFDIPVIASGLFDDSGILRGMRLVTDARGALPANRNDHWALGSMLRKKFSGNWRCHPLPLGSGDTPAASFVPNQECTLGTDNTEFFVRQTYFHRTGQSFRDEFGVVHPNLFVSETYFQIIQDAAAP